MFADDLLLLSGQDIPFPEAQITIHPPTLKEIGLINERNFFIGIDMLNFSKNKLSDLDKSRLEDVDDFEIFMSILGQGINDPEMEERINAVLFVLSLIFPDYQIAFQENAIVLQKDGDIPKTINAINFKEFKQLIVEIFCLNKENANTEYPKGRIKLCELFNAKKAETRMRISVTIMFLLLFFPKSFEDIAIIIDITRNIKTYILMKQVKTATLANHITV